MSARYHAPAVAYVFDRPGWAAAALFSVWLVLAATLLGWCSAAQWRGVPPFVAAGVLVLAGCLLLQQWRSWPRGRLQWNGEHWLLELAARPDCSGQPLRAKVGLDGGRWLWLELSSLFESKPISIKRKLLWILLSEQHSPAQWGDLRRAVYSSAVSLAEQG